jgi:carbon storage regulator
MLIFTRKLGEKITIGDHTVVTLIEIKDNQVRLGIEAPRHISVHRQEVYDRIRSANLASAAVAATDIVEASSILKDRRQDKE